MTEEISETPRMAVPWCPTCEPDRDSILEMLETSYCGIHTPQRDGVADAKVIINSDLTGTAEAGGVDNRIFCELIHRSKGKNG